MKIVFILGAGASKEANAPLVDDFLDTAERLVETGEIREKEEIEAFNDVKLAKSELRQVISDKSKLPLNIEGLYGAIEIGGIIGRYCNRDTDSIEKLKKSIKLLICRTIETSLKIPIENKEYKAPKPYGEFVKMIHELSKSGRMRKNFSIITFNYDTALEFAFNQRGIETDYCLTEKYKIGGLPYLKLHGSLNWGICSNCGKVVTLDLGKNYSLPDLNVALTVGLEKVEMNYTAALKKISHCDNSQLEELPLLVPPTWNKTGYHRNINFVWRQTAKELASADNIFMIGYSLPETDLFFQYLFALGSVSLTEIKRFWVINPDLKVEERVRKFLSEQLQDNLLILNQNFSHALERIERELRLYD